MLCIKFTHCKGQDARFTIIQISRATTLTVSIYSYLAGTFRRRLEIRLVSVSIFTVAFLLPWKAFAHIIVSLSLSWSCVLTDGLIQFRTSGWSCFRSDGRSHDRTDQWSCVLTDGCWIWMMIRFTDSDWTVGCSDCCKHMHSRMQCYFQTLLQLYYTNTAGND